MSESVIRVSEPFMSSGSEVWFTAYGFGWGYRAFSVSIEKRSRSGPPGDDAARHMRAAFRSQRRRIIEAVRSYESVSYEGQRIRLSLTQPNAGTDASTMNGMNGTGAVKEPGDTTCCRTAPSHGCD